MNKLLLKLLALRSSIKLVCMIGDIDGLRDDDALLLAQNIRDLRRFHYFLVHNPQMAEWLQQNVPGSTSVPIDFFDYLVGPVIKSRKRALIVSFAGNLAKSSFVNALSTLKLQQPALQLYLYGDGIGEEAKLQLNVRHFGVHAAYDMPQLIEGSFGLIWDGVSVNTCTGGYGEYLRINTQHKLSLYIVAGLPVIIWDQAATAALVVHYNIGVTIKNLDELTEKIGSISDVAFEKMRENMIPLAEKIRNGYFISHALTSLID